MSLYAEYIKERLGDECIETEEGFASYRFVDAATVYIVDIFVKKQFRKSESASKMADMVVEAAKAKGCTKLIGTVIPTANNSTTSLRVLIGYGMTLDSASQNLIVFKKEI